MTDNMPRVLIEDWLSIEVMGVEGQRDMETYYWYNQRMAVAAAGCAQKALRALLAAE